MNRGRRGTELAAPYVLRLLSLFFTGAGRYLWLDFWIRQCFFRYTFAWSNIRRTGRLSGHLPALTGIVTQGESRK